MCEYGSGQMLDVEAYLRIGPVGRWGLGNQVVLQDKNKPSQTLTKIVFHISCLVLCIVTLTLLTLGKDLPAGNQLLILCRNALRMSLTYDMLRRINSDNGRNNHTSATIPQLHSG